MAINFLRLMPSLTALPGPILLLLPFPPAVTLLFLD